TPIKLKTYNGQDNVGAWIEQFKRIKNANNWNDKFAKAQLENNLVHTAKIWFRNYTQHLEQNFTSIEETELEEILNKLHEYFFKSDSYIYENLDNLRQRHEETIIEYHTRFIELLTHTNITDELYKIHKFFAGLKSIFKEKIDVSNYDTVE